MTLWKLEELRDGCYHAVPGLYATRPLACQVAQMMAADGRDVRVVRDEPQPQDHGKLLPDSDEVLGTGRGRL